MPFELKISNLRTEYKVNPLGIGTRIPRFSWEINSPGRGVFQTAYRIQCARTLADLGKNENLLWDTLKTASEQSVHIEYRGIPLHSGERIYWQAKVWDNRENESEWSEPAWWEMALLDTADWKARWIEPVLEEKTDESNPCPLLRSEFIARGNIRSARAYITCHGLYKLSINGERVGDEEFTPGWTSYYKRLQYQVYDVTEQVKPGRNAVGVTLGDGWFRGYLGWQGKRNLYGDKLALLFQLRICYHDRPDDLVISNRDWKASTGPILKSDIYNGETYDARFEKKGWDMPGFDDRHWSGITEKDYGYGMLVSSSGVPVRITQTIKPVGKIITPAGELVFDMGQNVTGRIRLRLEGKKNASIRLQHAEVLDPEGNFYTENLRMAKAEDTYIFRGEETETYEPSYTFHGFRYVKVTEYDDEITPDDLEACIVHSDLAAAGDFKCSDPLINQLQKNIQWSLRGNFLDVPTDCPQRDERMGWTGDAQVFAPTACFNVDTACFYAKWLADLAADQKDNGSVPWVIPNIIEDGGGTGWSDGYGSAGWADAAVLIPWTLYQVYGDIRVLKEQYESMRAWEEYMISESGHSCLFDKGFHFGDWLAFAEYYSYRYNAPDYGFAGASTEKELIATAYFYHTTELMLKTASVLGKDKDAKRYANILPDIKAAFQHEFMSPSGRLTSNTQTAYILALSFGLLPENRIKAAAKRLADNVKTFGHLTTGFLGTPLICQTLAENGYPEIAYALLFNKKYPSWLYPVTKGATTIWERWDGIRTDGSFQTAGMNSFNHYAYGAVGNWLYTAVAGIRSDEHFPGYKRIIIKPFITERLTYAKASYHSVYGDIVSAWERNGNEISIQLVIPANASARVFIPWKEKMSIFEENTPVQQCKDIKVLAAEDDRMVLEIGSGTYKIKVTSDE